MIPAYIAAPYRPAPGTLPDRNILRAEALAQAAMEEGRAPIVIHSSIRRGVYGDDNDAEDRARGIEAACAIAAAVAVAGGELWILVKPEGGASPGSSREGEAFERAGGVGRVRWFEMSDAFDVREIA